jgi:uncharacterized protein (TIRG00374 family)
MAGTKIFMRRHIRIGRWLGILISLVLLIWVIHAFDMAEVIQVLKTADYLYLFPVLTLLVLNFAVRAVRWGTLFRNTNTPRWNNLFVAMMIGYLGNNILPARAGEVVRAYALGKRSGSSKSMALATVMVERILDLLVAVLLLAVVLLLYPIPTWLARTGVVVGVVGFAMMAFLLSLGIWGPSLLVWVLRRLDFLPEGLLRRIEVAGNGFVVGVQGFRTPRQILSFLFYTVVIWSMEVVSLWLIAQAFSLPLSIGGALFVMVVISFGMMIPSSPGYVGTYEFFAVSALAVLNISGSSALSFALMMHIITFVGSSILGAICLALSGQRLMQMSTNSVRLAEDQTVI